MKRIKVQADSYSDVQSKYENLRKQASDAKAKREEEQKEYYYALKVACGSIKSKVIDQLNRYCDADFVQQLYVFVRDYYDFSSKSDGVEIVVDNSNNASTKKVLRWDIRINASLEGRVTRETGSWSGLSAATPSDVEYLTQCVNAINALIAENFTDEAIRTAIKEANLPNETDYVKTFVPFLDTEAEIVDTLKAIAGTDKFICADALGRWWYRVDKTTDKSAYVTKFNYRPSNDCLTAWSDSRRVSFSKLASECIYRPIRVLTEQEISDNFSEISKL